MNSGGTRIKNTRTIRMAEIWCKTLSDPARIKGSFLRAVGEPGR